MLEIKSTTDYDQFKTATGNRFINPTHVRRVIGSLSKSNYMAYNPILVNEKMEIIDGQHRLAAARHLHLPVHYVVVPQTDLETIRTLNSSLKAWSVMDFVESYMKTGSEDYETLYNFSIEYGIPVTTAAAILGTQAGSLSGGGAAKQIRDGLFRITNLANAHQLMADLKKVEPFTEGEVWISRDFIKAFIILLEKGGKPAQLIEQLKKQSEKIRRQTDYRRYLIILQDIYNFNMKKEKISII